MYQMDTTNGNTEDGNDIDNNDMYDNYKRIMMGIIIIGFT